MKNIYLYSLIITVCSLALFSCSEIEDTIPTKGDLPGIHPEGFGSVGSPNFHTAKFAKNNWDLKKCQSCHGANYSGGSTGSNCLDCHTEPTGPEACNTCHGVFANPNRIGPPRDLLGNTSTTEKGVGAHLAHGIENSISRQIDCFECHPSNPPGDEGFVFNHIDGIPAEMQFGTFPGASSTYDFTTRTCNNTYCHGNFSFEKATSTHQFAYTEDFMTGNNFNPIWNKVDDTQDACGTCHGQFDNDGNLITLAPKGHIIAATCDGCHPKVVDANNNIIDATLHINKQADFGN